MSWLKQRRLQLGLTQDEITAKLQLEGWSITRGAYSHWENGQQPPLDDPRKRDILAKVLRVSSKELLSQFNYPVEMEHSEAAEKAADIVDSLPDEIKTLAIEYLELLHNRYGA